MEYLPASERSPADKRVGDADPYALTLPNMRAMFLPDVGYVFVEADLARADAQVIAWEAGATELKHALRDNVDIHSDNARDLYGSHVNVRALHVNGMTFRDNAKRWVHATNFAGGARTVAQAIVCPENRVKDLQDKWCRLTHPAIGALHDRLRAELSSRRNPVIYNRFGFRKVYVGGDRAGNLLGQALAWIAQSTVAIVINHALLAVDCSAELFSQKRCGRCLVCDYPDAQLLHQNHDSILLQLPSAQLDDAFVARFSRAMDVEVPYADPLHIASEIKFSDQSWGDMHEWPDRLTVAA